MKLNRKKIIMISCLIAYFIFIVIWSLNVGIFSHGDEKMRFQIAEYIFNNDKLPTLFDKSIYNERYGFSYAGIPGLGLWIGALFMKIQHFALPSSNIVIAARLESILCAPFFMFWIFKIAQKLFKRTELRAFLIIIVCLWPNTCLTFTYINNESLMLVGIAMNIYFIIRGLENKWSIRSCVGLAISDIIIILTYLDGYGFVLVSTIVYVVSNIIGKNEKWIKKGCGIFFGVFIGSAWFYLRNLYLYGSLLGNNICEKASLKYADPKYTMEFRSNQAQLQMFSIKGFFAWFKTQFLLFFGAFKSTTRTYPLLIRLFVLLIIIVLIGMFIYYIRKEKMENKQRIFIISLLVEILIVWILNFYYCAFRDYLLIVRYLIPMMVPFGIIMTIGMSVIFDKVKKNYSIAINTVILVLILIADINGMLMS